MVNDSFKNYSLTEIKKEKYFNFLIEFLHSIEKLSTCLRRHVGAVIFNDHTKDIISYGYNGAPRKVSECLVTGCRRMEKGIKSGENLNACIGEHAEVNAIINNSFLGNNSTDNMSMICSAKPCLKCLKAIVNSGIKKVFYLEDYNIPEEEKYFYDRIVNDSGIILIKVKGDK